MNRFFASVLLSSLIFFVGDADALELTPHEVETFAEMNLPGLDFSYLDVVQGRVASATFTRTGDVYHFGNKITDPSVRLELVNDHVYLNGVLAYPTSAVVHHSLQRASVPAVVDHERSTSIEAITDALRAMRDQLAGTLSREEVIQRAVAHAQTYEIVTNATPTDDGLLLTCAGGTGFACRPMVIDLFGPEQVSDVAYRNACSRFFDLASRLATGTPLFIGTGGMIHAVSVENSSDLTAVEADLAALRTAELQTLQNLPPQIAAEIRDPVDLTQYRRE